MSDGGAAVIAKGVEGAVALAKFRVGRVVLWAGAAWMALTAVTATPSGWSGLWFFLAIGVALLALVGGFLAERRKRAERAALKTALMLIGFTLLSLLGALWLVFGKKKPDGALPPPTEEEVERLVGE